MMANELKEVNFAGRKRNSDHIPKYGGDTEIVTNLSSFKPCEIGKYSPLDSQITYLKHSLKDVREIVLMAESLLSWDKQWYPSAIVGGSSILFMFLWLADPSLLTTIAVLGLIVTLADYLLPTVLSSFVNQENWTVTKEKQFENICRIIIIYKTKFATSFHSFYLLRTTRPKIYYGTVIISLLFLSWIGNIFNNLFLTYLLVTLLLLLPGLEKQGILPKYGNLLSQKLFEFTNNAKAMATKNKNE